MGNWRAGSDAAGLKTSTISVPTLIADGSDDQLDPLADDQALVRIIRGSRLVLYPDAGHHHLTPHRGILTAAATQPNPGPGASVECDTGRGVR